MDGCEARLFTITGMVQGVGFRPFVYRLAHEFDLVGWVLNDTGGVRVHAEGTPEALDAFASGVRERAPEAARVDGVAAVAAEFEGFAAFEIRASANAGAPTTRISPDLCVCADCLRELADPADRRHGYAYINCTNCGPRYSILRSLPYDRPRTTMAAWELCDECRREYGDPRDRRYHAQPTACPNCGPDYRLVVAGEQTAAGREAIGRAASMLAGGAIVAVKGIGGYHLACDARNESAVTALRERKFRKEKPFAVMARDVRSAERLARLCAAHRELLESVARPIVLAPAVERLPGVHPGVREIGIMLPYTPLHELLFDAGAPDPLVLTSANRSSEPIAYEDDRAFESLGGLADAFLVGERPIHRRVDDSVIGLRGGRPAIIRRARGYAPGSVGRLETRHPILAVGADLKNTVALAVGGEVFVSQHIGDLGDVDTDRAFGETIDDLLSMYAVDPGGLILAHDLHPGYVSTRLALSLPCSARVGVQHHEAHIASVLLEHGEPDTAVIGVALDGTGFGRDGSIWGGELFAGSASGGFERIGSLSPVSMPGGDAAARSPVQAASAYLADWDPEELEAPPFGFPARFRRARAMVARGTRCIRSTSAGRLFDAVAAVCGFTREITFEGQAAIWLEQLAEGAGRRPVDGVTSGSLDPVRLVGRAADRRRRGVEPAEISAAFHDELAGALSSKVTAALDAGGAETVVASGGVWQNERLSRAFGARLPRGVRLLENRALPANDGGISAGQILLAHVSSPSPSGGSRGATPCA